MSHAPQHVRRVHGRVETPAERRGNSAMSLPEVGPTADVPQQAAVLYDMYEGGAEPESGILGMGRPKDARSSRKVSIADHSNRPRAPPVSSRLPRGATIAGGFRSSGWKRSPRTASADAVDNVRILSPLREKMTILASPSGDSSDEARDTGSDLSLERDETGESVSSISDADSYSAAGSRRVDDAQREMPIRKNAAGDLSRIRYSKPPSRSRRNKRVVDSRASRERPFRMISESPFSEREGSSVSSSTETRAYNAYTDTLQNEARGDGSGLRTIVELLRDSEGNPIIIEKASLVIGILSENDAATRDAFGQFTAIQTLIQCLSLRMSAKFDRALIVKNVTFALSCLLRDSPRNVRLFEMFNGPYKMGKAASSERFENKPDVPKFALQALSELKYHPKCSDLQSSEVLSDSSTTGRTITHVLRAMALHEYRTEIQEYGLDALRTMLSRSEKESNDTHLLQASINAAATAFKMHKESAEVSWQCMTLYCDLEEVLEETPTVSLDLESLFGSLHVLLDEAQKQRERRGRIYESLAELVRRGLDLVGRLANRQSDFIEKAVEGEAVETVLKALEFFGGDREEVDRIQSILRTMLDSDEGKYRMGSVQAACAILEAIETGNKNAAIVLA